MLKLIVWQNFKKRQSSVYTEAKFDEKRHFMRVAMSNVDFRLGKKPFYDNKRFRRGFAKSGDFTLAEEEILIRFGDTMNLLEVGELAPESEEERHFLQAVADEKQAESKLEKTWIKYIHLARDRKKFHTLNGKKAAADESTEDESDYNGSNDDIGNDIVDDEPIANE
jgi:uncharacterized protein YifE (UPF0438 family)